eukprot:CFRG2880T1
MAASMEGDQAAFRYPTASSKEKPTLDRRSYSMPNAQIVPENSDSEFALLSTNERGLEIDVHKSLLSVSTVVNDQQYVCHNTPERKELLKEKTAPSQSLCIPGMPSIADVAFRTPSHDYTVTSLGRMGKDFKVCDGSDILRSGSNTISDESERRDRQHNGSVLSKFSQESFWLVLAFALVITLPFVATLMVFLSRDNAYLNECYPRRALSLVLVTCCGALHLIVVLLYVTRVYKYRENAAIKARGRYFLLQTCFLAPFVPILGTLNSLVFMGLVTNDCIFTYQDGEYQENHWSWSSIYIMMSFNASLRLLTTMFFSGVIARQLYLMDSFTAVLLHISIGTERAELSLPSIKMWITRGISRSLCCRKRRNTDNTLMEMTPTT